MNVSNCLSRRSSSPRKFKRRLAKRLPRYNTYKQPATANLTKSISRAPKEAAQACADAAPSSRRAHTIFISSAATFNFVEILRALCKNIKSVPPLPDSLSVRMPAARCPRPHPRPRHRPRSRPRRGL
ncbi:hypothetical protein EVAR_93070_1 [Eumeta japonica]|uniref:Uncharacterized protein n=1 Tax=Eumeta variegata TaxID=151549 RepID=A0A4C1TF52_EUMVA|nr:hypothetical protein EVAR_93070_1 [Eumeta japonica]